LKLKYDEPLITNVALSFNLRHCIKALAEFSRDNLIPTPFDPRLLVYIAPAVVRAAQASGVAARPIKDLAAYAGGLTSFVYRTNTFVGLATSLTTYQTLMYRF
jgi:malic enzyme